MKLFVGHDPTVEIAGHEGEGVDLLLTIHDDDTHEFAVRPGEGRRDLRWGPPSLLVAEPMEVCS